MDHLSDRNLSLDGVEERSYFTNRAPLYNYAQKTLEYLPDFEGVEFALRYQEPLSIGSFDSCTPNVSAGDTPPIMHQNISF